MVLRKRGRLARHEKWVMNGYRYQLEEADFSTYLGYTFTAKVSANKGLELITVRGKRKVTDILRALWRIVCTEAAILPLIGYASSTSPDVGF